MESYQSSCNVQTATKLEYNCARRHPILVLSLRTECGILELHRANTTRLPGGRDRDPVR